MLVTGRPSLGICAMRSFASLRQRGDAPRSELRFSGAFLTSIDEPKAQMKAAHEQSAR